MDDPSFLIALDAPENELSLDLADIVEREDAHDLLLCVNKNLERACEEYKDQDALLGGFFFMHIQLITIPHCLFP